ncbi:MAG: hypothetical protein H6Q11_534 [Acidobacteria bacterium]|nr:hypothetical protein [Acidobacteriota bacterium]
MSAFGIISGLGGITHGVGEALQGNVAPAGIVFDSWVEGPIAAHMGGEPGVTVVPNLLATGALTVVFSLAMVLWSGFFAGTRHAGRVQVLLSAGMLLVGGGFAPPVIGMLAGAAGLRLGAPHTRLRKHLPAGFRRFLARLWPWVFGVALANGALLVAGSIILVYVFDVDAPEIFVGSFLFAIASLLLSAVSGVAFDIQHHQPGHTG